MSDIHDLEQRLQALEDAFAEQSGKIDRLLEKSDKALDLALHAYKVDHYGYIWQYDCETKEYVKSNMRVCTPEIADRALQSRHIADKAIEGRHLQDNVIDGTKIAPNTIPGRCIADESITGDYMDGEVAMPGKIATDAVQTRNIKDKNVTPEKLSDNVYDTLVKPSVSALQREDTKLHAKDADLQNQIDSLEIAGVAVSNEFGTDPHISISQKTMTDAINKLWQKLEDMTGEVLQGFSMTITPEYYIGETGADVHITANTVDTNGIFEHITFYGNGVLIAEADNVDFFEHDFHVDETSVVKCVAKIMGIEYKRQSIITHYSSFLLGSGNTYQDLMDANNRFLPQYVIPITNGMRGAYDVDVAEGNRIIVVVGSSLSEGFIRADLNGAEIQFTESTCTDADGKVYKVFTSEPWSAGTYNIDING